MTSHTPLVPSDVVWVTRCPVPTATAIALHHGWFEEAYAPHGYKIQTLQDSRDPNIRAQHFYHDIKTLFREGGNVPAFWARAQNLKTKGHDKTVVIGLTWVDEVQLLLARPNSGLNAPLDLKVLKGKTFGVSQAGGAHSEGPIDIWRAMALRGYRTVLELAGLTHADITLKDLSAPHITWSAHRQSGGTWSSVSEEALLNGDVDVTEPHGLIRFSCPTGLVEAISSPVAGFLDRYPKVQLQLVATDRPVDLIAERIDLALRVRLSLDSDASLTMRTLGQSTRILVAAPQLAGQIGEIEQLKDYPLLVSSDGQDETDWPLETDDGRTKLIRHSARMGCTDFGAVRSAAIAGLGVAFLPDHVCQEALRDGGLVRVLPTWRGRQGIVHLVFTTRRGLPPAVRKLIDHLAAGFPRNTLSGANV